MLADIVALMLAFFVLSFSMRELVDGERRPPSAPPLVDPATVGGAADAGHGGSAQGAGTPLALTPRQGGPAERLRAPERAAADAPSLAYLAAILRGDGAEPALQRVRHDATRLVVDLPITHDAGTTRLVDPARRPLLALAFLAGRFDLDLAIAMPEGSAPTLAGRAGVAVALRDWLVETTGVRAPEVTFEPAVVPAAPRGVPTRAWAALQLKAAPAAAGGALEP